MTCKQFYLSSKFLCDKKITTFRPDGSISSTGVADSDKFTELRNKLSSKGFIKIETRFWNGDKVVKEFKLNGILFKLGDQFPCASAIRIDILVCKKKKIMVP